jgi:hypothetical protein
MNPPTQLLQSPPRLVGFLALGLVAFDLVLGLGFPPNVDILYDILKKNKINKLL